MLYNYVCACSVVKKPQRSGCLFTHDQLKNKRTENNTLVQGKHTLGDSAWPQTMEARWDVPENMTDFKKKTGQKLVSVDQEFLPP